MNWIKENWAVILVYTITVVLFVYSFVSSPTETSSDSYIEPDYSSSELSEDEEPQYFHGDECTDDCSGHEAGYNWAEEHGIDNPDDCGGNSDSFIEGCQSYAEENQ